MNLVSSESLEKQYLQIRNLTKIFGDFAALKDVSLDVFEGEFVCFLGPSGCGKTTLLRAIAGLDIQTQGTVEQEGRDVSTLPAAERDFGIVFQSYALFPNLTVADNVGYGLVNMKADKAKVSARVEELLSLVGLSDQGDKHPAQLSGGQQQRVALARALAMSPGLLLLDEPLSALDAKVRVHLRHEMKELQRRLGVTTIMVTHDQEEALTMADRIVVMNKGVIEQVGTPEEIYRHPASLFVAEFVGTMNFIDAGRGPKGEVVLGDLTLELSPREEAKLNGGDVITCVRPEDIKVRNVDENTVNSFPVTVTDLEFLGSFYRATLNNDTLLNHEIFGDFSINLVRDRDIQIGNTIRVALPVNRLHIFRKGK
ncbi:putative 2-aminoethylphosphonate ABC transporter ATP-binding protein [Sneathiella chinensis]|uniref:Fe(3+) ions import ATP-binding protein FbpC n=1 Tax=Sneathiella chinensis TaxID=349750 RepID=A0ABQ5U3H3_9PROT|nr:putative 2-aminoethylphosphonate ABC transporter ATP-binding protein [Sneathiella chinensis]GLQ06622.1 Fe(3+) ions import ATP-binding protein FbpC [Sneathiella chinensis]